MVTIHNNFSLKKYNTFGIDVRAKHFCIYNTIADLQELQRSNSLTPNTKVLILGEGSNLLFTKDFDGVVIYPQHKNTEIIKEADNHVFVKVDAGKKWDEFVSYAVSQNYGGIENLSGIPGNVGATPVQNIGAYGVEAKDVIFEVNAVELLTGERSTISNKDCQFAYRSSIFKTKYKNRFIIDSVVFKLSKQPEFNINYGTVKEELQKYDNLNLQNIRQAIIDIRAQKLPDPKEIGNAGSFFKNPIVSVHKFIELQNKYPDMPYYKLSEQQVKIPAGWLIEKAGLKGYVSSNEKAAVHEKQALVLINAGGAKGTDIAELSDYVQLKISNVFDIKLEPEVIYL